ncbi:MAG: hypothetical protein KatS3mg008_0512 [Acidimicrobiales bacterium]|nr:MAG: hypothetical protein KatS3mg008_0512 [Acidimicrobiales bacterium]
MLGGLAAWAVFGAPIPALVGGAIGAIVPAQLMVDSARTRRKALAMTWATLPESDPSRSRPNRCRGTSGGFAAI